MSTSRFHVLRRTLRGPRGWFLLVLVTLLALELALRAAGFGGALLSRSSARYGWRIVENQSYVEPRTGIRIDVNDFGFRDRPFGSPEPIPDVRRVAWLGNSMIWGGAHVELERRCDRELEKRVSKTLAERGSSTRIQTLNFAQPGYTFEQMARLYEDVVRPFHPAVLVVPLTAYDFRPRRAASEHAEYPFWRTIESSALFDVYKRFLGGGLRPALTEESLQEAAIGRDPLAPEYEELRRALEARVASLALAARAEGTRVIVVAMPTLDDVLHPERPWIGGRWTEFCAARGLEFVDPRPRFLDVMGPLLSELAQRGIAAESLWRRDGDPSRKFELRSPLANCFLFDDPLHLSPRGHFALADALYEPVLRALES